MINEKENGIQKSMRRLSSSDPSGFWKLFDTQIEPILTNAAEVWGIEDVDQIEKVQTFAMKRGRCGIKLMPGAIALVK